MSSTQAENHYQVLGLNSSATPEEIRRAYRILARRYHPDVNPGSDGERFRAVSRAYETLIDPLLRQKYDGELDRKFRERPGFSEYERQRSAAKARQSARQRFQAQEARRQAAQFQQRPVPERRAPEPKKQSAVEGLIDAVAEAVRTFTRKRRKAGPIKVSMVEVSVSCGEAIFGIKKTVEIPEESGTRKVSIVIPPGVRTGSVLRLKAKDNAREELMILIRVAAHPYISLAPKGVIVDLPIGLDEAIGGAVISIPTFGEQQELRIPAGIQTGHEIRLEGQGVAGADGKKGDLFVRLMVRVPTCAQAVGIKERASELARYYEAPPRQGFPRTLRELV